MRRYVVRTAYSRRVYCVHSTTMLCTRTMRNTLTQSIALHTTLPVVAWAFLAVLAEREGAGFARANALIARLLRAHVELLAPGLWGRAMARDAEAAANKNASPHDRGAALADWIRGELDGGGR